MTTKISFSDCNGESITCLSSWRVTDGKNQSSMECQTSPELFLFANMETQSGLKTEIIEDRVGKNAITLLQHYCTLHRTRTEAEWRECIALGKVTVDCVVAYNPELKLQPDTILQFINKSSSKEVIVREGGYLFHFIPNPFFLFSLFTFPQKIKIFGNE